MTGLMFKAAGRSYTPHRAETDELRNRQISGFMSAYGKPEVQKRGKRMCSCCKESIPRDTNAESSPLTISVLSNGKVEKKHFCKTCSENAVGDSIKPFGFLDKGHEEPK
jgi:hypothetical protein